MLKYKLRRYIPYVSGAIIMALIIGEYALVWYAYYGDMIIEPFFNKGNWLVIFIYAI